MPWPRGSTTTRTMWLWPDDDRGPCSRPSRTWGVIGVGRVWRPGGGMKWRVVMEGDCSGWGHRCSRDWWRRADDEAFALDRRVNAGRGKAGARRIAAPSRSRTDGGSLLPPAAMPAVWTPLPIKDKRSRRLVSLFGTVNVSSPRFLPCRCASSPPDPEPGQRDHARPVHTRA